MRKNKYEEIINPDDYNYFTESNTGAILMSKSLYEEAIADAKKVREAAEENAKNAILESVTPKIREFIEQTILEQDLNEEKSDQDDEKEKEASDDTVDDQEDADKDSKSSKDTIKAESVELDESAISTLLSLLGGEEVLNELSSDSAQSAMNSVVNEAISNLSDVERDKLFELADNLERNIDILERKEINNHVSQKENNTMAQETFYEVDLKSLQSAVNESAAPDSVDELDDKALQELMMMLEQEEEVEVAAEEEAPMPADLFGDVEVEAEEEVEVEEEGELPPSIESALDALEDAIAGVLGDVEADVEDAEADLEDAEAELAPGEEVEVEEEEEIALAETFEVDPKMLRREIRKIRRELREGKHDMEHHFGGKGHANAGVKNSYGGKGSGKVGTKKSFGGGSEGQDPFANPPQMNKLSEALRKQLRENRALNEKLGKYRSAVKTLREQLEDLNLFNAKLLYVNKLLQNKSLTEAQRKSVIRALDKASSLNEAKTLYKSLTESFSSKGKTLNESTRRGSSSRTTTSATASQNAGEAGRWAKLAGLK